MENFINNLGWKKLAITMIVGSIISLIFIIISFQGPESRGGINSDTFKNLPSNYGSSVMPGVSNPTSFVWQIYQGKTYKIQYPPGFSVYINTLPDDGTSTTFLHKKGKILIETFNASVTSQSKILNDFSASGYTSQYVNVGNLKTVVFTGSLSVPGGAQEKAYVFENNGTIYKILLTYISMQKDTQEESILDQMVSSLKLL